MRDDTKQPLEPGPSLIRDAALRILDGFVADLVTRAAAHDGQLSAADLKASFEAVHSLDTPTDLAIFDEAWRSCYALAESAHWAKARRSHFERTMVKGFSDLLPRSSEPLDPERHLSRRVIPGFINALQQMMGQEQYEQHSERVEALVETIRAVHGDTFSWDDVYADPICQTVVEDVLVGVSHHFADMAKRRNWLIDVITAHMPAASSDVEKAWHFGDAQFHALMNALYDHLRQRMLSSQDRAGLVERYGDAQIAHLSKLFEGLAADHADLTQAGRI